MSPSPDLSPDLPVLMPERLRVLLFLNGVGLFAFALFVGWQWFIALLGQLVVWPILPPIEMHIPGDARAWRMVASRCCFAASATASTCRA